MQTRQTRQPRQRAKQAAQAVQAVQRNQRYWTPEEHQRFLEAVQRWGYDFKRIAEHVGTKTIKQVYTHKQKHLLRERRLADDSCEPAIDWHTVQLYFPNDCEP
jgi:SHAQKYF class myb-like DNA-binding protein